MSENDDVPMEIDDKKAVFAGETSAEAADTAATSSVGGKVDKELADSSSKSVPPIPDEKIDVEGGVSGNVTGDNSESVSSGVSVSDSTGVSLQPAGKRENDSETPSTKMDIATEPTSTQSTSAPESSTPPEGVDCGDRGSFVAFGFRQVVFDSNVRHAVGRLCPAKVIASNTRSSHFLHSHRIQGSAGQQRRRDDPVFHPGCRLGFHRHSPQSSFA